MVYLNIIVHQEQPAIHQPVDGGRESMILNMVAAVEITGDTPPAISGITNVRGTLSTGPIEISATLTDANPGGGSAGIKSAFVVYHTDVNTTDVELPMAVKSGDVWAGSIPVKYLVRKLLTR